MKLYIFFHARLGAAAAPQRNLYILCLDIFYLPLYGTVPVYSNSLTYLSLSDLLPLQCPQMGQTPLDLAEEYSKEEAVGVLRRHGAKRGAELWKEEE